MVRDTTETKAEVDLAEVNKLVDALERDLEKVSSDSAAVQRLKDEVQTLKNVTRLARASPPLGAGRPPRCS